MSKVKGKIHSFESFGAVDGPGIRFVAFLQGCPLRCLYCHNSDTWDINSGKEYSANDIFDMICSYKNFIKSGGVTLSGGEPLMQTEFVSTLLTQLKEEKIHTAIDTSGIIPIQFSKECIDLADLILLDIKELEESDCINLTGKSNKNALDTLNYCESIKKPVWIRHVCIPNYTLNAQKLEKLSDFLKGYNCIEKVELIPFHQLGAYKWEYADREYVLNDINPPSEEEMQTAKDIFAKKGLKI